jgi:lipopolysaccharide/colanic/teichoic acid biosynthesis glycosyltransferase
MMSSKTSSIEATGPETQQGACDLAWLGPEAGGTVSYALLPSRPIYEFSKRVLDIVLTVIALLPAVPILIVVSLAVRCSSRGSILFSQTRVGRYSRPFTCLKFRTMVKDAHRMLADDPELGAKFVVAYKLPTDPRVTRVGRILRKLSLDELPQLWNVLRGEMSLVGPRPVLPEELRSMYGPAASQVLSVRPGLTGLWQVSGRCATSYEERVQLDLSYVERQSLHLDLWIIARTPIAVLTMRGAQ